MEHDAPITARPLSARRGRPAPDALVSLGCCCGAVALVWLVVLPWYALQPAMQAHLEWLDARQVDPSAMYYTELEAMRPILRDLNNRQRAHEPPQSSQRKR